MDWEKISQEIDMYLVDVLQKIEWKYGENRAPFVYPATCYKKIMDGVMHYYCELTEDSETMQKFIFEAIKPEEVYDQLVNHVNTYYFAE